MYSDCILNSRQETKALRFLQYIGGCGPEAPQMSAWPDDLIKSLIYKHRLEVQASFFFQSHNSSMSKSLLSWIDEAANKTIKNSLRQLDIINELYESSPSLAPSILIKGNQLYISTDKLSDVSRTGDIDLVFRDPDVTAKLIEEDGLAIVPFSLKPPHEFINFRFRGMQFDCHEYVPTLFPPPSIIDYASGEVVFSRCPFGRISFADILRDALCPSLFKDRIRVPSSAMNVVISIATLYRDYLCGHSPYRRLGAPPIRFNDLLRIQAFMRTPSFDWVHFKTYINEGALHYPARWAADLLLTYLSDTTLGDILDLGQNRCASSQMSRSYPQILLWSLWHGFKSTTASYILRHPSVEEVMEGVPNRRVTNVRCNATEHAISGVKLSDVSEDTQGAAPEIKIVARSKAGSLDILIVVPAQLADNFRIQMEGPEYSGQIGVGTGGDYRLLQSREGDYVKARRSNEGIDIRCNMPSWTSCKILFAMVSYKLDVMLSDYSWIWTVDLRS
jgi:hypothetical protein